MEPSLTPWLMGDTFGDLSALPPAPDWYREAACLGTDPALFFPEGQGASAAPALAICERCAVREACAAYADAEGLSFGVWGGLSEKARKAARRDDRAA